MYTKDSAYSKVSELVTRFDEQYASYKKSDYNETLTRRDFIDPFFRTLGWDIDNQQGFAEAYREVIHEDRVKVRGATKAPDYSFRLSGGKRLFFVEAKKPSVQVKDEIHPSYQVRRYGWSAKLPVSIITDFEEFSVYDCTKKPHPNDRASVARINYLTYKDYLNEFDFLWSTFSKEHVLKGSFDKFIQSDKNKKGTTTVDKEFLQSLDGWRTLLALSISKNNKNLDEDELNFVVQSTIDRIIFLRIAEDRGIETYAELKNALTGEDYYKNLLTSFRQADDKYNSGLFDFRKDRISSGITIENKVVKKIINELYYPESPYEFAVLPVEILGSAYEQFLGKVIRIDKSHKAKIEEKPEVRKAGGVYYTPQYIVDYIVKNTVGKLVDGKTPNEVSKLKIVDPACGSGSFLLGAYQFLLDWHKEIYSKEIIHSSRRGTKGDVLTAEGSLTTSEKKRILLNNIFGVDIDANAVEVTKLSLLLKCLEGETSASIEHQLSMFNERVLPTLDDNVKVGNSLIDTDFYSNQLDFGEEKKIKPFNWQKAFPEVFEQGGFDAVIGNPPYVFGRDWKSLGISDEVKTYLGSCYRSSPYQLDFFSIFMERGVQLACQGGFSAFIVPNVWLTNTYSSLTRKFLLANSADLRIAVPESKVFEGITVDTVIYSLKKGQKEKKLIYVSRLSLVNDIPICELDSSEYESGEEPISTSLSKGEIILIDKIRKNKRTLVDFADITRGVHPYRVGGFGKSAFANGVQIQRDVDERPYHSGKQKEGYRPFIYGRDLKSFSVVRAKDFIKYGKWLAEPRDEKFFEGDRIYSRKILGDTLVVTVETKNSVADQQVYITKPRSNDVSVNSFAAILGSKLISFFIRKYFDEVNDAFPQIKVSQLKMLPIQFGNAQQQQELSKAVQKLLEANEELSQAKLENRINQLQGLIDYCTERINQLVYELYGLTEEEIRIVEGDVNL
jgi:type I restriction-modification system DNA methylase subunit